MDSNATKLDDGPGIGKPVPKAQEKPGREVFEWHNGLSEENRDGLTVALMEAAIPPAPQTHLDSRITRGVPSFGQEKRETEEEFKPVVEVNDTLEKILERQLDIK